MGFKYEKGACEFVKRDFESMTKFHGSRSRDKIFSIEFFSPIWIFFLNPLKRVFFDCLDSGSRLVDFCFRLITCWLYICYRLIMVFEFSLLFFFCQKVSFPIGWNRFSIGWYEVLDSFKPCCSLLVIYYWTWESVEASW